MARSPTTRVVLVDDEPLLLSSYRRALRPLRVRVETFEDPLKALEALADEPAAVVVADYLMESMNGDEFLERVRALYPDTVRILVTASSDVRIIEAVVRRGDIFRFVPKPFGPQRLQKDVGDALELFAQLQTNRDEQLQRRLDLNSYRQMFESASDPMMFADSAGRLVRVNDAFVAKHGSDLRAALDARSTLVVGVADEAALWTRILEAIEAEGHWSGEVVRGDYVALLTVSQVSDDEGRAYAFAAVEKDITTQRQLENQNRAAQYEVILALAKLAEYRDPETGAHLERMRRYSQTLARNLAAEPGYSWIDDEYVESIFYSSPLHDVGKVGVPDSILLKPGRLTTEEWVQMRAHTTIGAEVLSGAGQTLAQKTWLSLAQTIAMQHHERFDGTGYPAGLEGAQIDIAARIVALADAYDAIRSRRVYKPELPHDVARERIVESRGTHFDPTIVDAFHRSEEEFVAIAQRFADDELAIEDHLTLLKTAG